jgi:hypothetical protein
MFVIFQRIMLTTDGLKIGTVSPWITYAGFTMFVIFQRIMLTTDGLKIGTVLPRITYAGFTIS